MSETTKANIIKIAAVITAAPRWVAALLAAEGFTLPTAWLGWWIVISTLANLGMAIVEGFAFAFIFEAWRNQNDKRAAVLLNMAIASGIVFIAVIAPQIAASVRHVALADILANSWALGLWAACVAASTILIVASVGYAQKQPRSSVATSETQRAKAKPSEYVCETCEKVFGSTNALNAHMRAHTRDLAAQNGAGE